MSNSRSQMFRNVKFTLITPKTTAALAVLGGALLVISVRSAPPATFQLSRTFQQNILAAVLPEAPFELRMFSAPVKTDSRGRIITGPSNEPVKNIVGAESAGMLAALE